MEILDLALGRLDVLLLVFTRLLGLFTTAPVLSNQLVPMPLRVAISLGVTLIVLPLYGGVTVSGGLAGLAPLVVQELLVGMLLGFVAVLVFTSLQFAGELLDMDMGLSIVNVLDPISQQQAPVIGNFKHLLAMLIFLTMDGHHGLLLAVLDSFALVPPGQSAATVALEKHIIDLMGDLFRIGFALASPMLAALFLITVAMAVVSRAVPQLNIFMVGMPAKAYAGLALLAALLPLYALAFRALFERMFPQVYTAIHLMK